MKGVPRGALFRSCAIRPHLRGRSARIGLADWVGWRTGTPTVGSVYCVRRSDEVAQLRLLFVDSEARRHGVGSKLVERCIEFARERGYERMMLSTVSPLESARRIYDAAGFRQTKEEPDPAFPEGILAQEMWLEL